MKAIEGEGLRLRPWEPSDVDFLVAAMDDPEIRRFLPHMPDPYTEDSARWWIEEGSVAAWESGGAAFAVTNDSTGEMLGGAGLGSVLSRRLQGEVGYWVAPWARRRGVATRVTRVVARWAFEGGLHRLELLTARENPASQRVALAAGFAREGVRRMAGALPDGLWQDLVVFARLSDDPEGPVKRVLPDFPGGCLTDGVVRLRPLGPADGKDFRELNELPEVARNFIGDMSKLEQRCATAESAWLAGEMANCIIEDAETGAFAGDISLNYREAFTGQAMLGYGLRPEFRGRGFATRAVKLISDWAFEAVGVSRLVAGTFPENKASQRVLERAGFEREAVFKSALPLRDGTRTDNVQFVRHRAAV
ncbi:GNAT family N-acetyltransferase [Allorhizocola rhizosphaerae]|uniref:GNAT family N-acetyltransferase n=1 Tax=Allorhizocola rhizosphaerae TaxID=1872709 RepID=UPI001FE47221|nr:GNAT family N-acetyltransferase [Allorhizocola rhizosphaerae]